MEGISIETNEIMELIVTKATFVSNAIGMNKELGIRQLCAIAIDNALSGYSVEEIKEIVANVRAERYGGEETWHRM